MRRLHRIVQHNALAFLTRLAHEIDVRVENLRDSAVVSQRRNCVDLEGLQEFSSAIERFRRTKRGVCRHCVNTKTGDLHAGGIDQRKEQAKRQRVRRVDWRHDAFEHRLAVDTNETCMACRRRKILTHSRVRQIDGSPRLRRIHHAAVRVAQDAVLDLGRAVGVNHQLRRRSRPRTSQVLGHDVPVAADVRRDRFLVIDLQYRGNRAGRYSGNQPSRYAVNEQLIASEYDTACAVCDANRKTEGGHRSSTNDVKHAIGAEQRVSELQEVTAGGRHGNTAAYRGAKYRVDGGQYSSLVRD